MLNQSYQTQTLKSGALCIPPNSAGLPMYGLHRFHVIFMGNFVWSTLDEVPLQRSQKRRRL